MTGGRGRAKPWIKNANVKFLYSIGCFFFFRNNASEIARKRVRNINTVEMKERKFVSEMIFT